MERREEYITQVVGNKMKHFERKNSRELKVVTQKLFLDHESIAKFSKEAEQ